MFSHVISCDENQCKLEFVRREDADDSLNLYRSTQIIQVFTSIGLPDLTAAVIASRVRTVSPPREGVLDTA